jgi:branched-chain amino acid transport system ATP-binding protein
MEQAPLLKVNNIEVIYEHIILVLKGVSLEVPGGGIVSLLGANGAGKTTTLKAISNLVKKPNAERSPRAPSNLKVNALTGCMHPLW